MKLELRRVSVAAPGAQDARRSWPERQSLLLRCSDADGRYGVGEASPLPGYSRDDFDHVERALADLSAARVAAALDVESVRGALGAVSALVPVSLPSARMALETAALDLLGKRRGQSAPALLGAAPDASRDLAALVGPAASPALPQVCDQAVAQGFRHLKLKLGTPGQLDAEIAAVVQLRSRYPSEIKLRLDANGGLNPPEIAAAWLAFADLDLELFEEPGPMPEGLVGALPLGLDESLQGLTVAEALGLLRLRKGRCLVLKPMALGGVVHCLHLAEQARLAGASVVVTHCFDGPFAWRATAALALALPAGSAHGLAPHAGLTAWRPTPLPVTAGELRGWSTDGLGAPAEDGFS